MSDARQTAAAMEILRENYLADVGDILSQVVFAIEDEELEPTEESVAAFIREACRRHERVTTPSLAILTLLFSAYDAEIFEELPDELAAKAALRGGGPCRGGLNYDELAYHAFHRDAMERAQRAGLCLDC